MFVTVANYDILILARNLRYGRLKWEKNLYSRVTALTVEEIIEDIRQLSGNEFREIVKGFIGDGLIPELNSQMKLLTKMQKQNEVILKDIRNVTIAHRDKDALKQLAIIEKIDPFKFEKLLADLIDWLSGFIGLITRIIEELLVRLKLLQDFRSGLKNGHI